LKRKECLNSEKHVTRKRDRKRKGSPASFRIRGTQNNIELRSARWSSTDPALLVRSGREILPQTQSRLSVFKQQASRCQPSTRQSFGQWCLPSYPQSSLSPISDTHVRFLSIPVIMACISTESRSSRMGGIYRHAVLIRLRLT
jgi:hypothetical protein